MADATQLSILQQGVVIWNQWRELNPAVKPDLREADLTGRILVGVNLARARLAGAYLARAQLRAADLRGADLSGAELQEANLCRADLSEANLTEAALNSADLTAANLTRAELIAADLGGANLKDADLTAANLTEADLGRAILDGAILCEATLYKAELRGASLAQANLTRASLGAASLLSAQLPGATLAHANLRSADLRCTNLSGADLHEADLVDARLDQTDLRGANLASCRVYGISAWDLRLEGAIQSSLIITLPHEPTITVDDLEVAQFIYLLLNNQKIRKVIDTVTSKVVLILGRFTTERKAVLDAIRDALRGHDYSPVLFDFDQPASRDVTETVTLLARMSRFIIADITEPRSIPQELAFVVPDLPSVPVQPLLEGSATEYGMFEHFKRFPWVLELYRYKDRDDLLASLEAKVIAPAEAKVKELRSP